MFFIACIILAEAGSRLCLQPRVAVTRGRLEVFLDPSPRTRAAVTRRLIKKVLRPLHKDSTKTGCAAEVVSDLVAFADPALMSASIRDIGFPGTLGRALQDTGGELQIALSDSLTNPDPRAWDPREVALVVAKARVHLRARMREWPLEVTPDERIVDTPTVSGNCVILNLDTAKRVAAAAIPVATASPYCSPPPPPSDAGEAEVAHQVRTLVPELVPMGMIRAYDLLYSSNIEGEVWADPREIDPKWARVPHIPGFDALFCHFSNEFELYRMEWDAAHIDRAPIAGVAIQDRDEMNRPTVRDARREEVLERDRYVARRWFETDRKAPHPDVEKVRTALMALEAERIP